MSPPGKEDRVVRICVEDRCGDGGGPVPDFTDLDEPFRAGTDLGPNLLRVFAVRIIVGEIEDVRMLGDDPPHDGAFQCISIARGTSQRHEPSDRVVTQRRDRLLESISIVREVDDNAGALR